MVRMVRVKKAIERINLRTAFCLLCSYVVSLFFMRGLDLRSALTI